MKATHIREELTIPQAIVTIVFEHILEHELEYRVTEADSDEETLTIQVTCSKEDRDELIRLQDMISDYEEAEEEDDDE